MGIAVPAQAHDPSLSGIRILYRQGDIVVNVMTHISRLRQAEGKLFSAKSGREMDNAIRRRLSLRFNNEDFSPHDTHVIVDSTNDLLTWQSVIPNTGTALKECEVLRRLYPEDTNSRTVVSLIRDGEVFQEVILDSGTPALLKSEPAPTLFVVAARYIREGIGHIFGGLDHVLFVLGLLLLGGTLRALLRTVTAFTLAHSITLTLAATGVWNPSPHLIEPLIALSIVAIGVENLRHLQKTKTPKAHDAADSDAGLATRSRNRDLRPYYAFGFGLIHGFGFAGALAEVGLPKTALGIALSSFNIGVEIGQVAIILLLVPGLVWLARKHPLLLRRIVLIGSLLIGIAGAYWFCTRL